MRRNQIKQDYFRSFFCFLEDKYTKQDVFIITKKMLLAGVGEDWLK